MTPTVDLETQLRNLLDERIPAGGAEADTRFTTAEIAELLTRSATVEMAAYEGWIRKAGRAMSERGGLEKATAGDETLTFVSIQAYRDHCLQMAAHYTRLVEVGTRLFGLVQPDVAGVVDNDAN